MEQMQSSPKRSLLTEGIILAAIPIIAYYSAYNYEVGYYRTFGAPESLITVDTSIFITFGSAILGLFLTLYFFMDLLWSLFSKISELSWKRISFLTFWIFCFLLAFEHLILDDWLKSLYQAAFNTGLILCYSVASKYKTFPKWLILLLFVPTLLTAYSGQIVRIFRRKPSTHSDLNRPPIPFKAIRSSCSKNPIRRSVATLG